MTWLNVILLTTVLSMPKEVPQRDPVAKAQAALRLSEETYGPRHPATAMMLRNLALVFETSGMHNRAEAAAKQSLAVLEGAFGGRDASLTPPLNVLTEIYVAEGRLLEARIVAERAVKIGDYAEAHYATALHNLGAVYEALGRFADAREAYRRALTEREKWLTASHPFVGMTREALNRLDRQKAPTIQTATALR